MLSECNLQGHNTEFCLDESLRAGWRRVLSVKGPAHALWFWDSNVRVLKQSGWTSLIRRVTCYMLVAVSTPHRLQPSYLRSNHKHRVPECLDLPVAPPGSSSSSDPWRRRAAGPREHSAVSFVALWIFCSGTTPASEHSQGVKHVSWPQGPAQTAALHQSALPL